MRSKILLWLVAMMMLAVPAFAAPTITFTFSGTGDALFEDIGIDFTGDFSFKVIADTAALGSGNMTDLGGNVVPVTYYGGLTTGSLSVNGVDLANANAPVVLTEAILEELYVAYNILDGNLSLGIWDPTLITDPTDIPLVGDFIAVFDIGAYDMKSEVAPTTTGNIVAGGAVTLATSGIFALEALANTSPDDPFGTITWSAHVPEPSMFLLFGAGMLGFGILRKKF